MALFVRQMVRQIKEIKQNKSSHPHADKTKKNLANDQGFVMVVNCKTPQLVVHDVTSNLPAYLLFYF
jgi:hypothetical protein